MLRVSIVCLLWLGACTPSDPNPGIGGRPSSTPETRQSQPSAATEQIQGPPVLGEVDNGFRRIPIPLSTDYGFLVLNAGDEDSPKPRVAVGMKAERRIVVCDTIPQFEAALRSLPATAVLHRHDRCLRPAATGLSPDFLEGIEQALARTTVKVAPDATITCICGR